MELQNILFNTRKNILVQHLDEGVFLLCDEHTKQHCLPLFQKNYLPNTEVFSYEIASGEKSKTLHNTGRVWEWLMDNGASRKSTFVALGGGMVTDMGGFVASTFKRGMDLMLAPTTLLAMVDAAIGGKTGINWGSIKNQIGTFYEPTNIVVDTEFLTSLPKREWMAGFAECLKHGLIADAAYWQWMNGTRNFEDKKETAELVLRSIQVKTTIIQQDYRETGLRKALNFGHTIGHAVEAASLGHLSGHLLHGEAVVIGMLAEAFISQQQGLLSPVALKEIQQSLVAFYHFPGCAEMDVRECIDLMRFDKKNDSNGINFTLLQDIGCAKVDQHADDGLIRDSLDYAMSCLS